MELAERLRRLRQARGLTATEAARRSGISGNYLRMLESGRREGMSVTIAAALAEVYGVSVDELIGGEMAAIEAAARRRHALDLLEDARQDVVREPLVAGPEVLVPDRGGIPIDRAIWDSRGEESMLTPIPPAWLAGLAPHVCFVVTVAAGSIAERGVVPGMQLLFSRAGTLVDGGIVLICLFERVRLGVYRARGERVELAGDGEEADEAWPDDGYEVLGYYLAHWNTVGNGD